MDVAKIPRNFLRESHGCLRNFLGKSRILILSWKIFLGNPMIFRDSGGMFFWMLQKFLGICVKLMDV